MPPGRRPKIRTSAIGTPGRAKGAESVKSPLSDTFGTDDETHTWTEEEALAFLTSEGFPKMVKLAPLNPVWLNLIGCLAVLIVGNSSTLHDLSRNRSRQRFRATNL